MPPVVESAAWKLEIVGDVSEPLTLSFDELRHFPGRSDEADDVVLSARERNQDREAAMREYLEWEINLVHDMASDDDHRFQVVAD